MDAKLVGKILRVLGYGLLFVASMMDTTVEIGYGRVHNIGLLSQQQTLFLLGGISLIAGIFLYAFEKDAPKKELTEAELEAGQQYIDDAINWVAANVIRPIKTWMDERDFYIRLMVSGFVGISSLLFFDNFLNFYSILAATYILIITPVSKAVNHVLIANTVVFIVAPILLISAAVFAKASGLTIDNADGMNDLAFVAAAIGLSEIAGWIKFILLPIAVSIASFCLIEVIKPKLILESKVTPSNIP